MNRRRPGLPVRARLPCAAHLDPADHPCPGPVLQAKPTAGVSYVVRTESLQEGADGMPQLPHLGRWRGLAGTALAVGIADTGGPQVAIFRHTHGSAPVPARPCRALQRPRGALCAPAAGSPAHPGCRPAALQSSSPQACVRWRGQKWMLWFEPSATR